VEFRKKIGQQAVHAVVDSMAMDVIVPRQHVKIKG
jgi:hypothetical protein